MQQNESDNDITTSPLPSDTEEDRVHEDNDSDEIDTNDDSDEMDANDDSDGDIQEEEEMYEVEDILQKRGVGNNIEYLVKWKGYSKSEATWEHINNLENCKEIVAHFEYKEEQRLKRNTAKQNYKHYLSLNKNHA